MMIRGGLDGLDGRIGRSSDQISRRIGRTGRSGPIERDRPVKTSNPPGRTGWLDWTIPVVGWRRAKPTRTGGCGLVTHPSQLSSVGQSRIGLGDWFSCWRWCSWTELDWGCAAAALPLICAWEVMAS